jgi:hypothetical protein
MLGFRSAGRHGPAIKPPVRKGFGTVLLETTFSGPDTKRRLAFKGSGLTYELDIPTRYADGLKRKHLRLASACH